MSAGEEGGGGGDEVMGGFVECSVEDRHASHENHCPIRKAILEVPSAPSAVRGRKYIRIIPADSHSEAQMVF